MSRYDANRSADLDGWGGGFEDPRFAGGRRPDDDNEGFDNVFGGSPRAGGGRRIGCGCFLTLLGLGAAATVICCGGLAWFGLQDRADRVAAALADDPAFRGQLEEALGPDYRLSPDVIDSLDAPPDTVAFEATGSRGSGRLTAFARRDRDVDPNADPQAVTVLRGTLQLDDGRTIELQPEADSPAEAMRRRLEDVRRRLEELRPEDLPLNDEEAPAPDEGPNGDEPADEPQIERSDAFEDGDR
ncbi:hypothetical protein [Alienimonas californiensis]|uniref:Uncharacterized protein n=1 Tax=Alienimonas californiensis TaxID=2527989 RepID=A0A517P788_9PLAN|nr:hypothetical protein [Alienimonas californiensis]QDT15215.1 hypothetical protein CA12_12970 [Alienimonas californiensis]